MVWDSKKRKLVETMCSGIVLGILPVTLLGILLSGYLQFLRGDGLASTSSDSEQDFTSRTRNAVALIQETFVGLSETKSCLRKIAALALVQKIREAAGVSGTKTPALNMALTGGPGTGKTEMGKILGDFLFLLGLVSKGQTVIGNRAALVGGHLGQTAAKTRQVIDSAHGGVLVLDEAHLLYNGVNGKDYGSEALEVLLQAMEDERDKVVFVITGPSQEITTFFNSNKGVYSRITHHLRFPDLTSAELVQIALANIEDSQYTLDDSGKECIKLLCDKISSHGDRYENARTVKNLIAQARLKHSIEFCMPAEAEQGQSSSHTHGSRAVQTRKLDAIITKKDVTTLSSAHFSISDFK
jgi:hypothetical protein